MTSKEWLNQEPTEQEISLNNGKPYLSIEVVKRLLDEYCELIGGYWTDSNFSYSYNLIGSQLHISGSIQLTIYNNDGTVHKSFSGGSNSSIDSFISGNIDQFVGSINSMALTFAARKLGARFGGNLYAKPTNIDEYGEKIMQINDDVHKHDADIYNALLGTIKTAKTKTQAQKILDKAPFPLNIDKGLQDAVDNFK